MNYERALSLMQGHEFYADISELNEACEIATEALEKQIPKKPIEICEFAENDLVGICPICNEGVNSEMEYCSECGQKLEW